MTDVWLYISTATPFFASSGSTVDDERGPFVGIALKPPSPIRVDPEALAAATQDKNFVCDLMSVFAEYGVLKP